MKDMSMTEITPPCLGLKCIEFEICQCFVKLDNCSWCDHFNLYTFQIDLQQGHQSEPEQPGAWENHK